MTAVPLPSRAAFVARLRACDGGRMPAPELTALAVEVLCDYFRSHGPARSRLAPLYAALHEECSRRDPPGHWPHAIWNPDRPTLWHRCRGRAKEEVGHD